MNILYKKIDIPIYLQELHGYRSTVFDLLATYLAAILVTVLVLLHTWHLELPVYKVLLLAFLALDLGGGVVANFTEGTNEYYSTSPSKRYLFIAMHVLQPLLLSFIFPDQLYVILIISVYTLLSVGIVNRITLHERQRVAAALLMVLGIIMLFITTFDIVMVTFLLLLYVIKLIMAFAVRWR